MRFTRFIIPTAAALALAAAALAVAWADEHAIEIVSAGAESEFPEGMRFSVAARGESDIEEIAVRLRIGQRTRGVYEYIEFDAAPEVDAELFWRTNSRGRYIPPGTIIAYNFEITDADGNSRNTEPAEFIYHDARFTWEEVSEGPVAVAYHGPVKTRAELVLEATVDTLNFMGPLLGADTSIPIRVTMYNNVKEMLDALPPGSTTHRRELITEGQAFTDVGMILTLGGGRGATGTASHEATHILTHRAGDGVASSVPSWLDEGLAEFGNVSPSFSYDIALEFAIGTDRLLPISSMPILPGDPEDVIIFYGQASSLIEYMIVGYGAAAMRDLMAALKSGTSVDDAIREIYGVERIELENLWRDAIGAPAYVAPNRESAKPTPIPRAAVQLYTLTPQAGSDAVGSLATPTPEPSPTEPPGSDAPATAKTDGGGEEPDPSETPASPGCGAPASGSPASGDIAAALMALAPLGLAGIRLRKRGRR